MLYLRLDGTEEERELFLSLLPILTKDIQRNDDHLMGVVDFSKVDFLAHCAAQYGTREKNNRVFKDVSRKKALELREQGLSYEKIAKQLNINGYKTSRGKFFSKMQVKRLIDESKGNVTK